jgi:hypothetical protein
MAVSIALFSASVLLYVGMITDTKGLLVIFLIDLLHQLFYIFMYLFPVRFPQVALSTVCFIVRWISVPECSITASRATISRLP